MTIAPTDILLRLLVALVLGSLLGLERERLERAAGLRTHALVAVGACLVMIVSAFGFADAVTPERTVVLDPSRIAAQVVSGIGFLGAGVIIFRKNTVSGLTTAASVWAAAAVGLACGGALYWAAGLGTGIMLVVQVGLRPLEQRFFVHHQPTTLSLRCAAEADCLGAVEHAARAAGVAVRTLRLRVAPGSGDQRLDLALAPVDERGVALLLRELARVEGMSSVTYQRPNGRARPDRGDLDDEQDSGDDTIPELAGQDDRPE